MGPDGDSDGLVDYTAYNNGQPDGNIINLDLDDDTLDTDAAKSGTVLYITTSNHNGSFGGRAGLDSYCENYSTCGSQNVHAFISVNASDEMSDLPTNYGYESNRPIYWFNSGDKKLVKLASSWADMLDGSIEVSMVDGTGRDVVVWTGSNASGRLLNDIRYSCSGWTDSSSCQGGWNFHYSYTGNVDSGAVTFGNQSANWLYYQTPLDEKLSYGPDRCGYYNTYGCPSSCPSGSYSSDNSLLCTESAYLMCASTP